jgi:opacity protein-like surface antigen
LIGLRLRHHLQRAVALAVVFGSLPVQADPYLRLGVGFDGSLAATFRDSDCASVQPPALFGCGAGRNGEPLGASGAFGSGVVLDAGLGVRLNRWLRAEGLFTYRPAYEYNGEANFLQTAPPQPVYANLSSIAAFGVGYVDLPKISRLQPFIGAGVGAARNRISAVTYGFPTLAPDASTTIAGGTTTGLAWLLTAGVAIPLNEQLSLDLAYRYTDLGTVQTDAGSATIVRPAGSKTLDIAGTQSALKTHGAMLSLRYAFR